MLELPTACRRLRALHLRQMSCHPREEQETDERRISGERETRDHPLGRSWVSNFQQREREGNLRDGIGVLVNTVSVSGIQGTGGEDAEGRGGVKL